MVTIAGAAAARTSDTDPLTTIGMVGEDPEADLVAARAALAAGDLDATLAAADDAYRGWTRRLAGGPPPGAAADRGRSPRSSCWRRP